MPNRRPSVRTRRLAAGLLAIALVPGLAGCFNGFQATTTAQATMNSGNGTQAVAGDIRIENATLVSGPEATGGATLVVRVVNVGTEDDVLTGVTIGGTPAYVTGDTVVIPARSSVSFGYESDAWINAYGLEAAPSSFVPVVMSMERAGAIAMQVLIVPPLGYYAGIAPNPPAPPIAGNVEPQASPSPTAS